MSDLVFEHRERRLELRRAPDDPTLRAWDAADVYALDQLFETPLDPHARILLVNDAFGALACALAEHERVSWGDSELGRLALRANERANAIADAAAWRPCDVICEGRFDAVIVKLPRERSLLDYQLATLRSHVDENTRVIGAGMTRHVHNPTISAFERFIGATRTTHARQKARLLLAQVEGTLRPVPGPHRFAVEELDLECIAYAGVFSQKQLDDGTQLLLRHLPRVGVGAGSTIADLGCGAGVLGAAAARMHPDATVVCSDESALAVRSARETFAHNGLTNGRFVRTDGLSALTDASVDLLLSNPPQHQSHASSQALLASVLAESRRVLRPGGQLVMVANRHVNLNVALASLFSGVDILEQDRRFMVCAVRL